MLADAINIALAVFAISLLILVHEFGHFVCAKAVGMRVEEFSLGFWKKLIGFRWGETEYRLSLIPLGGYVRVAGESPEEAEGKDYEFWSKSPGQRAIFVLGGVTMNVVLALALFVAAFGIGVPFAVAEVGDVIKGMPAWEAGLQPGDRIVAVDGVENPTFEDLSMKIALSGEEKITLKIERDGRVMPVRVEPAYNDRVGMQSIGVLPPIKPVVTGFARTRESEDVPAAEAGVKLGDRILAVNGHPVESAREVNDELLRAGPGPVELRLQRGEQQLTVTASAEPRQQRGIGISGGSLRVEALQPSGEAAEAGLGPGDRIVAVNGQPVQSLIGLEHALRGNYGQVELTVERGADRRVVSTFLPGIPEFEDWLQSVDFMRSNTLTWVGEGTPAYEAGLRLGDTVTAVGGKEVDSWEDIGAALAGRDEPVMVEWERDGETHAAAIQPVLQEVSGVPWLGVVMDRAKTELRRYGVVGAVKKGITSTFHKLVQLGLTLKAFATRQVSTRHMGSIVMIATVTFHAAQEGFGKLFHIAGYISAALAFFNLLPIPVLDGGHLVFLAAEKVRGKPLSERTLFILQMAGLVVLLAIFLYATRNDILRLVGLA